MAALAQCERAMIAERTRVGMAAARERGQHVGRRRALTPDQCEEAMKMLASHPAVSVAEQFQIHPRTLRRNLRRQDE
jgi:DNA invertase Pin-like site-specific DNA recombinase